MIFAGGRREFIPNNETDPEYLIEGERLDGRNLIQEWVHKHPNSQYVWNKTGFDKIDEEKVDHVIGWWLSKLCDCSFGSEGDYHSFEAVSPFKILRGLL